MYSWNEHQRLAQPGELGNLLPPRIRGRDEVNQSGVVAATPAIATTVVAALAVFIVNAARRTFVRKRRAVDQLPTTAIQSVLH